jgi:hypothetical protein
MKSKLMRHSDVNRLLLSVALEFFYVVVFLLLSMYAGIWISREIGKPVKPDVLLKRNVEVMLPALIVIRLLRLTFRALGDRKRSNVADNALGESSDTEQLFPSGVQRPRQTFDADLDRICSRCLAAAQKLDALKVHPDLKAQMLSVSAECHVASVLIIADRKRDGRAKIAVQNGEAVLREFELAYFGLRAVGDSADIDRPETLLNTFNAAQKRRYAAIMIRFYRKLAVIRRALAAANSSPGEHLDSPETTNAGADYDRLMHDHELEITSFFQHLVFGGGSA